MFKIAHIGDLHICGKNFERAKSALLQVAKVIKKENCNAVVFSGDIFDHHNISDRYKTVGELQSLLLQFIASIKKSCGPIFFVTGNHDSIGEGKSALEFLKNTIKNVHVIEKRIFVHFQEIGIGLVPWISKAEFVKQKCIGKSKQETDNLFKNYINKNVLNYMTDSILDQRKDCDTPSILFGHCDLIGHQASDYYKIAGGSFPFSPKELKSTGADYISLSHIHKRSDLYVGALFQNNFGEENNPQGFEIVSIDGQIVKSEYKEIKLKTYKTIEVKENDALPILNENCYYKLRFFCEKKYKEYLEFVDENNVFQDVIIEKQFNQYNLKRRSNIVFNQDTCIGDLLEKYMDYNPPEEQLKNKIMEYADKC